MPALTPDTIRTLTETLSDLTDYNDHDPYARDLQGTSNDAADAVHELGEFLSGFGEQFRTFAPDVIRTSSYERPPAPGTRPPGGG